MISNPQTEHVFIISFPFGVSGRETLSSAKMNPQKRHFRASSFTSSAQSGHFLVVCGGLKDKPHFGHSGAFTLTGA
jgi:hypothetical protein